MCRQSYRIPHENSSMRHRSFPLSRRVRREESRSRKAREIFAAQLSAFKEAARFLAPRKFVSVRSRSRDRCRSRTITPHRSSRILRSTRGEKRRSYLFRLFRLPRGASRRRNRPAHCALYTPALRNRLRHLSVTVADLSTYVVWSASPRQTELSIERSIRDPLTRLSHTATFLRRPAVAGT